MNLFESIYKKARFMEDNPDKYPNMDWLTPENSHYDKVKSTRHAADHFQGHNDEAYDMDDYYERKGLEEKADDEESAAYDEYLDGLSDEERKEKKDWQVKHAYDKHNEYKGDKDYEIKKDFEKKEDEFAATQHHIDDDYSKSDNYLETLNALQDKGIDIVETKADWDYAVSQDWEFSIVYDDYEKMVVPVRQIISYKNKDYLLVIPYTFDCSKDIKEADDWEQANYHQDFDFDYILDWVDNGSIPAPDKRDPKDAQLPDFMFSTRMKPMEKDDWRSPEHLAEYYNPATIDPDSMYLFKPEDAPLDNYDDPEVKELVDAIIEIVDEYETDDFWKENFND